MAGTLDSGLFAGLFAGLPPPLVDPEKVKTNKYCRTVTYLVDPKSDEPPKQSKIRV